MVFARPAWGGRPPKHAVCIVGAGPGGTQLHKALTGEGVDALLIEARPHGSTRWHDNAFPVSRTLRSTWRRAAPTEDGAATERQDFVSISPWKHERRFHFEDQETDGRLRQPIPAQIFGDYLASQQDATRADASFGTKVTAVRREERGRRRPDGEFILETRIEGGGKGEVLCRTLVWAAGQAQPHIPAAARDLVAYNTTTSLVGTTLSSRPILRQSLRASVF